MIAQPMFLDRMPAAKGRLHFRGWARSASMSTMSLRQQMELAAKEKERNTESVTVKFAMSNRLPLKNKGRKTKAFFTHCCGRNMRKTARIFCMYITCIHATSVPKTNYNKTESVELYVPRLNEKMIGKTFVSRCGLTVPRGCVETITPFSYLRELSFLGFSRTRRRHNASKYSVRIQLVPNSLQK